MPLTLNELLIRWARTCLVALTVVVLAASCLAQFEVTASPAKAAAAPGSAVAGWAPHWALADAVGAVEANGSVMGEVSPFWFTAKASGGSVTVTSPTSAAARQSALGRLRAKGVHVLPTVADGSSAVGAMSAALSTASRRAAHIKQLVALAQPYDGLELDYEKFAFKDGRATWASTRPRWVAFIRELSDALHKAGKRLALAVPVMYDGKRTSSSGYWVYDYAAIASSVDSLRIMTYDYSVSRPGPISPPSFLNRTLSYAVTAVPAAKVRMGVPAYGRLWVARKSDGSRAITGTCPTGALLDTKTFTAVEAMEFLTERAGGKSPTLRLDATTQERVATFTRKYTGKTPSGKSTSCTVKHEAWWVDSAGVAARLPLVRQYGLAGVALWQLAGVDAATWSVLRAFAGDLKPAATKLALLAPPVVPAGRPFTVTATALAGTDAMAGVPVKLQSRSSGAKKWRTVATVATDAAGRATFAIPQATSTTRWRARVTADRTRRAASVQARTQVAAVIAAVPSAAAAAARKQVTIKASVLPGRRGVLLRAQVLTDGKWRNVDRDRTSGKGRATLKVRMAKAGPLTVRVISVKGHGLVPGATAPITIAARR